MKERPIQIWVHPKYKRVLKKKAAEKDMNIIELTKKLAEELDFEERRKNERRSLFRI